jgi:transcriptional regulator with XRE-family HTH domain
MVNQEVTKSTHVAPIRGAREARGIGLNELARRVGIDRAYLSRIERGQQSPSVRVLKRIADALNLPELSRFLAPYAGSDPSGPPSEGTLVG